MKPKANGPAETRQRILSTAVDAFARAGYDAVGMREIAAAAGVSPALMIRYFKSKAGLFEAAVEAGFHSHQNPTATRESFARDLADYALLARGTPEAGADGFAIVIRSATSHDAAQILKAYLEKKFVDPVAAALGGAAPKLGVELVAALVSGVSLLRDMLDTEALNQTDPAHLRRILAVLIEACLEVE